MTYLALVCGFFVLVAGIGWQLRSEDGPALDFTLIDHNGVERSAADWRGRPVLVFFGFTHCARVCPTTLGRLTRALDKLADPPALLLVTVDPERDSPAQLARYVAQYPHPMTGLTGEPGDLAALASELKVFVRSVQETEQINHSAHVYLFDRDSRLVDWMHVGADPGAVAAEIAAAIGEGATRWNS